jgi:hypothetical protein
MICRVVYILIMCHLSELGDAVKFLFVKKKTKRKKKKKISYCTSLFIDVTKGSLHMVSEPSSTRDLGFATAFVDMRGFNLGLIGDFIIGAFRFSVWFGISCFLFVDKSLAWWLWSTVIGVKCMGI